MRSRQRSPGETQFVAFLQPLEYTNVGARARTPIVLGLTERTLGVSFKSGSPGDTATVLINRQDIKAGHNDPGQGALSYFMETAKVPRMAFTFQSQSDLDLLASWVQAGLRNVSDSAQ